MTMLFFVNWTLHIQRQRHYVEEKISSLSRLMCSDSLFVFNIMCTMSAYRGCINHSLAYFGVVAGFTVCTKTGRIPHEQVVKVGGFSVACFFTWSRIVGIIPEVGVMAPLLPHVQGFAYPLPHIHMLEDGVNQDDPNLTQPDLFFRV